MRRATRSRITPFRTIHGCRSTPHGILGVADSTVIWFIQIHGRETRIIDVLKGEGVGLDWYAKRLQERDYLWGNHYLPHDVEVRELGTGKSRKEVLEGLGIKATVCPNIPIADGIQAVRMLLPTCWFDKDKCKDGIEACACIAANMTRSGRSSGTRCTTGRATTRTRCAISRSGTRTGHRPAHQIQSNERDRMTDADPAFLAFLQEEETRAYDGTLLDEVEAAINSYNGAEYGDEEDGRSQVVARDVAETTDYMLTSVLDAFVASGRVVEFEPSRRRGRGHCRRRHRGDALPLSQEVRLSPDPRLGQGRAAGEDRRRQVAASSASGSASSKLYHPAMTCPITRSRRRDRPELHPVDGCADHSAVTLEEMAAEFRDYYVPLEEFRVAPDARDLDSAVYLCHLTEKSIVRPGRDGLRPASWSTASRAAAPCSSLANARDDGRTNIRNRPAGRAAQGVAARGICPVRPQRGRHCRAAVRSPRWQHDPRIEEVDYQPFEYWCPTRCRGG
jgi:hypothetical protein